MLDIMNTIPGKILALSSLLTAVFLGPIGAAQADTLAIDFNNGITDLTNNFTLGSSTGTSSTPSWNNGALVYTNNGAAAWILDTPNNSANFTVQGDFSSSAVGSADARGLGFFVGLTEGQNTGFTGIFRLTNSGVEFRLFTGSGGDGSIGTQYGNSYYVTSSSLLTANTPYTLQMQVDYIDSNNLNFILSAYSTGNGLLLGSTTVSYNGALAADYLNSVNAGTAYSGLRFGNGSTGSATIDNFSITGVIPEPSTWALLLAGLILLCLSLRQRRHCQA